MKRRFVIKTEKEIIEQFGEHWWLYEYEEGKTNIEDSLIDRAYFGKQVCPDEVHDDYIQINIDDQYCWILFKEWLKTEILSEKEDPPSTPNMICAGEICIEVPKSPYLTFIEEESEKENTWTKKHYDFNYKLTPEDIEKGQITIDPYLVASQWRLGEKDNNSGILFHCLKGLARMGTKKGNTIEREITAIQKQIEQLKRFIK